MKRNSSELTVDPLTALPFPKPVRMIDLEYQQFIRRQPCINDGSASTFSHVKPKGHGKTGSKVSDYRGVPMCWRCHREFERIGRVPFEEKHNVDLDLVQIQYLETYISALKDGVDLGAK